MNDAAMWTFCGVGVPKLFSPWAPETIDSNSLSWIVKDQSNTFGPDPSMAVASSSLMPMDDQKVLCKKEIVKEKYGRAFKHISLFKRNIWD